MATRTIIVHDRCTNAACNRILHSIAEGVRGKCSSCWFKEMSPDTKKAINKVIACAFNGATEAERSAVVDDAIDKLKGS